MVLIRGVGLSPQRAQPALTLHSLPRSEKKRVLLPRFKNREAEAVKGEVPARDHLPGITVPG